MTYLITTNRKLRSRRIHLLAGAGTAVLAALTAGSAGMASPLGAQTSVGPDHASTLAEGTLNSNSTISNQGNVQASTTGTMIGAGNGGQSGSSTSATDNTLQAKAVGNTAATAISQTDPLAEPGVAGLSSTTNSGAVSATAAGNGIEIELDDAGDGQVASTGNLISASTTVNSATTTAKAVGATGEFSAANGTASITTLVDPDLGPNVLDASGDLVGSTYQRNLAGGSVATTTENGIGFDVGAPAGSNAALNLDNNEISSIYRGNTASTAAQVGAEGGATFHGSAVVANAQSNEITVDDIDEPGFAGSAHTIDNGIDAHVGYDIGEIEPGSFGGSLSITGNTITSSAKGNEALGATAGTSGNSILLADGVSLDGSSTGDGSTLSANAGDASVNTSADLAIASSQRNVGAGPIVAETGNVDVAGGVHSLVGGTVTVDSSTIGAAATGNAVSSAIQNGAGAASIAGTIAIGNQQSNSAAGSWAQSHSNEVGADVGDFAGEEDEPGVVQNATVNVTNNADRATAYGNSGNQSIALSGTSIPLSTTGVAIEGFGDTDSVAIHGAATIANLQTNASSPTQATVQGSDIYAESDADDTVGSALSLSGNLQEATAVGSAASNGLALTGTTVGSGAGVASMQHNDALSQSEASVAAAMEVDANDVVGSQLSATDNTQHAIAYGNSAGSNLSVTANTVHAQADGEDEGGDVAFGVLTQQQQDAPVTAITSGDGGIGIYVDNDLQDGASAVNKGNTVAAVAHGNQASNGVTLAVGSLTNADEEENASSVALIENGQQSSGNISASIEGGRAITTEVSDDVADSALSVTDNTLQATAYGNRANGNTMSVTGTSIDTSTNLSLQPAFAVGNMQDVSGMVQATQRSEEGGMAASIGATVDDSISNSAVTLSGNNSSTQASGNVASNGLSLSANALNTTAGVQNMQQADAQVTATAGQVRTPAVPGTPDSPFSFNASAVDTDGLAGSFSGSSATLTGGTLQVATTSLTPAQISQLELQGWTPVGATLQIAAATLGTIPVSDYTSLLEGGSVPFNAIVAGTPGTPARPVQGGVQLTVGGDIANSTLKVTDNSASVGAVINNAANSLSATGTEVAGLPTESELGSANLVVQSQQLVSPEASATADIAGGYSIGTTPGAGISSSTLDVSGNSQVANALANVANNSLSLTASGGTVDEEETRAANTALYSDQEAISVPVSATSNLELTAPVQGQGSTLTIGGNSNTALAVTNDVTNTLTASGLGVIGTNIPVAHADDEAPAVGDHVLDTTQNAGGTVHSAAVTTIGNADIGDDVTQASVSQGGILVNGNTTMAEASANRALNTVTVTGGASQPTAALANHQTSSATVTSSASTTAMVALTGTPIDDDVDVPSPGLANGSVALNGNSTTALARGNAATNAMTVTGAGLGIGFGSGSVSGGVASATAPAVVLNSQSNNGAVSAQASGGYSVALNAGIGLPVASASIALGGNNVSATAYGNTATNTLQLASAAGSSPSGMVANIQRNTGAVSATASGVSFGTTGTPAGALGSSVGIGGNQIAATAIGNSVVTTVTAGR